MKIIYEIDVNEQKKATNFNQKTKNAASKWENGVSLFDFDLDCELYV